MLQHTYLIGDIVIDTERVGFFEGDGLEGDAAGEKGGSVGDGGGEVQVAVVKGYSSGGVGFLFSSIVACCNRSSHH